MSDSHAIVVSNFKGVQLSLKTEFHLQKNQALEVSKAIVSVTDKASMEAAVQAVASIKGILKGLESARVAVKEPVLKLGRDIDALAKGASPELLAEGTRVNNLVQEYYREEERKAEASRKLAEKFANQKREKEEAKVREAEAEQKRLADEAAQAEDPAEAQRLQEEAERKEREAAESTKRAEEIKTREVAAPAKVEGMSVRKTIKHEVTDLAALYAVRPDLVTLEPKTSAINIAIRSQGLTECPGLRIWTETDTSVRA